MAGEADLDTFVTGLDSPMFVVTTVHPDTGERAGCLVGFATQTSIEPDRFAVWLSQHNHTYTVAMAARVLAVHGLAADQIDLAELFGTRTGDNYDKFADCRWSPGPYGVPILDDCPRWFAGEVLDRTAWGNHTGFLVKPVRAVGLQWPNPLMYSAVAHLRAGHPA